MAMMFGIIFVVIEIFIFMASNEKLKKKLIALILAVIITIGFSVFIEKTQNQKIYFTEIVKDTVLYTGYKGYDEDVIIDEIKLALQREGYTNVYAECHVTDNYVKAHVKCKSALHTTIEYSVVEHK